MTRETVASNASRGEIQADGRLGTAHGARWDLDLLTPDDVCALLKVKKSWLYDAVEDGSIETIRLGKHSFRRDWVRPGLSAGRWVEVLLEEAPGHRTATP